MWHHNQHLWPLDPSGLSARRSSQFRPIQQRTFRKTEDARHAAPESMRFVISSGGLIDPVLKTMSFAATSIAFQDHLHKPRLCRVSFRFGKAAIHTSPRTGCSLLRNAITLLIPPGCESHQTNLILPCAGHSLIVPFTSLLPRLYHNTYSSPT